MKILPLLTILYICTVAYSQEQFLLNTTKASAGQSLLKATPRIDTTPLLYLPFYEDFAHKSMILNKMKWEHSDVYINQVYVEKSPSIGIATFDALDAYGNLHEGVSSTSSYCDTLTSLPIAMFSNGAKTYTKNDLIALGFHYQIGGLEYFDNVPSSEDSLILEFYYPSNQNGFFINEVMNSSIELYNASDSVFSLSGVQLKVWSDTSERVYNIQSLAKPFVQPFGHFVVDGGNVDYPDGYNSFNIYKNDTVVVLTTSGETYDTLVYLNGSKQNSYGRVVDGSDDLAVFFSPTLGGVNGEWEQRWSVGGFDNPSEYSEEFEKVSVLFDDPKMFVNGFRFRFINTSSISNDPSHARSIGIFNIDQIYIDTQYVKQPEFPDVAFATPMVSLLRDYHTVPYSHYEYRTPVDNVSSFYFTTNNFSSSSRGLVYNIEVEKLYGDFEKQHSSIFETNLPGNISVDDTVHFDLYLNPSRVFAEDVNSTESASFEVKMYFEDDNSEEHASYRHNDTLYYTQSFSNYFAYDDGTAEAGYGVRGESNMSVGQKFEFYKVDTIREVSFFFNTTPPDPLMPAKRFFLAVWADDDNKPGELLYKSPRTISIESVKKELFQTQKFTIEEEGIIDGSEYLIIEDKVHVGWIQTTDYLMNIGVDLNRKVSSKIYYRFGDVWTKSLVSNPLMINLFVGANYTPITSVRSEEDVEFEIFPNPVAERLFIETELIDNENITIKTLTGSAVNALVYTNGEIDVSTLPNGVYFIRIEKWGKVLVSQPFVVKR